jgi:hypothetical protein
MIFLSRVGERSEIPCRSVGVLLLIAIVVSSESKAQQTFRQLEGVNEHTGCGRYDKAAKEAAMGYGNCK